jgi:LacI family transcriptional regulator
LPEGTSEPGSADHSLKQGPVAGPSEGLRARQRATIRDVAELAGVHPSTVSRVLNGDDSRAVAPTRQKIRDAAAKLGWRPNSIARSLSVGRSYAIGMSIPSFSYPPHAAMIAGAERAAELSGNILVVMDSSEDEERLQSQLLRLSDRVDGFIVSSASLSSRVIPVLEDRKIPFVLLNRRASGSHRSVIGNDEQGVRLAVQHLFDAGHRRLAYLGVSDEIDTAARRFQAFSEFARELGVPLDKGAVTRLGHALQDVTPQLSALLAMPEDRRPTALFADNLLTAANCLTTLRSLGASVPEDYSVVGFDNAPIAAHLSVPLTAVQMPNEAMGAAAVASLLRYLEQGDSDLELVVNDQPYLEIRGSTRPLGRAGRAS